MEFFSLFSCLDGMFSPLLERTLNWEISMQMEYNNIFARFVCNVAL